jgi:hypothetical protein
MFGDVEIYQRQLDRIAGILDGDDEDAMADLVQGETGISSLLCPMSFVWLLEGRSDEALIQ